MTKYFFTADWHNYHANVINFCNRSFKDIKEMEECLLDNHNSMVNKNDMVFFLGDIAMTKNGAISILEKINGKIYYTLGNHDIKFNSVLKEYCVVVKDIYDTKIYDQKITMCHYAMRVWNCSHYGSWNIHGHSHGTLPAIGLQYDCGVDNNNYKPISFEELYEIMKFKKGEEING